MLVAFGCRGYNRYAKTTKEKRSMPFPQCMILDMDEVLFPYAMPFSRFFCKLHGPRQIDPSGPDSFDMSRWLGTDKETVLEAIREFNSGEHPEFGQLPPLEGAVAGVHYLRDRGVTLHAITSSAKTPKARMLRRNNVETVFGRGTFTSVEILHLHASKEEALSGIPPALFVDDLEVNLEAGKAAGHLGILMSAAHNRETRENYRRRGGIVIDGWRHLVRDLESSRLEAPAEFCPQGIPP